MVDIIKKSILVLCVVVFLFVAHTSAASATITITQPGNQYVGIWSQWLFAYADAPPNNTITIAMKLTDPLSGELSTDALNLDGTTRTASFRVKPSSANSIVTIEFTINGDADGQFFSIPTIGFVSLQRPVTIEALQTSTSVNTPSEPLKISLLHPSTGDLTFTPNADDVDLTFSPTAVVIPAGQLSGSFTQLTKFVGNKFITVAWTITGDESDKYANYTSFNSFVSNTRRFNTPAFSAATLLNANSTTLYISTSDMVNGTVKFTPKAADTVFTPDALDFTPGMNVLGFSYVTTTPQVNKPIFYYIEGPGAADYAAPVDGTFSVPKRSISVQYPSAYIVTKKTQLSVRISAPAFSSVTVTLFAANLVFNPTNVTFSGSTTAAVVEVLPVAIGTDVISYLVSGADAEYYNSIAVSNVYVDVGQFIGPADWYVPTLWLGVQSDKFPVRINIIPPSNVTLTLSSPDLIFTPPTLQFTPDVLQQYVQITPSYTATLATDGVVSNPTITFLVSGADYAMFTVPAPKPVSVSRRSIQTRWSSHVTQTGGVLSLFLQKEYFVWVTANYVNSGETVTVTPTSPYATFDPAVATFTSAILHVQMKVKVTAVRPTNSIVWVVAGATGGLYTNVAPSLFTSQIRPLAINSAVIAPSDRVPGTLITAYAASYLGTNHIYAFSLMSSVIPDNGLTITPKSSHVTFSPESVTLGPSALTNVFVQRTILSGDIFVLPEYSIVANFSVKPKSAGIHEVFFELSGADAPYYDVPDHVALSFWLENRVSGDKPADVSAANSLATSSVLVLVAVVMAVFAL